MATTLITRRPSALAAVCSQLPVLSEARPTMAQAYALGRPADVTKVRTASTFGITVPAVISTKINNYIGTVPAAALNGANPVMRATTSILAQLPSAIARTQHAGTDKAKGGDARGIPPRGRRTV